MRIALLVCIILFVFTVEVRPAQKKLVANATLGNLKDVAPNRLDHRNKLHVNWTHIDILVDDKKKATNSNGILNNVKGNPHDKIPSAIDDLIKKVIGAFLTVYSNDKKKVELINATIYDGVNIYNDYAQGKSDAKTIEDTNKFLDDSLKLLNSDDKEVDFLKQVEDVKSKFLSESLGDSMNFLKKPSK